MQLIINIISKGFRLIPLLIRRLQRLPFWRRRSLGRAGQVGKDIEIQNLDGMINLHDNGIMRVKEEIWVDLGRRRIELKRRVRERSTYLRLVICKIVKKLAKLWLMLLRTIYLLASGNSKCNLQNVGSCLRGQSICSHLAIVNLSRIFRCSLIVIILFSIVV